MEVHLGNDGVRCKIIYTINFSGVERRIELGLNFIVMEV